MASFMCFLIGLVAFVQYRALCLVGRRYAGKRVLVQAFRDMEPWTWQPGQR